MVYALRHYQKGVKSSGTKDLWVGDVMPTRDEIAQNYGSSGKYVIMERGKGIRGMRKVAEYIFDNSSNTTISPITNEWMPKLFAAEQGSSMSVRKEIKLTDLSNDDLNGLWDSMLETPVDSDDDFERFVADNSKIKQEVYRRLNEQKVTEHNAEEKDESLVAGETSGKFGYGVIITAGVVGLVAGAVIQEVRWKKRFADAEDKMKKLEDLIDSLSEKTQQAAETNNFAASGGPLSNHNILRSFNQREGF